MIERDKQKKESQESKIQKHESKNLEKTIGREKKRSGITQEWKRQREVEDKENKEFFFVQYYCNFLLTVLLF